MPLDDAEKLAEEVLDGDDPRISDKRGRGPAGAIRITLSSVYPGHLDRPDDPEAWFFFGWAERRPDDPDQN